MRPGRGPHTLNRMNVQLTAYQTYLRGLRNTVFNERREVGERIDVCMCVMSLSGTLCVCPIHVVIRGVVTRVGGQMVRAIGGTIKYSMRVRAVAGAVGAREGHG